MKSNVDVIKDLYANFASGDMDRIRSLLSENIVWTQMRGFPGGGRHIGVDKVFEKVFQKFDREWTDWQAVVTDYLDAGDAVIAIGFYEGTFSLTSKSFRAEFAHHYQLNDGKVILFQQYTDTFIIQEVMKT
ncbi:Ketosteroid isomerase-related protein [Fulvivirga imtechensis AK7]|uniref:Ketosteroid isomerase-related protein n=1 Tax=Fulvivirga imtechensis AK7 TaxID=1237149 RepID=L8K2A5_9BACT|nr:nuclear transport factor 2 family protein [Fulvivirga imtechensis]ELR73582.1 Ketosteroid isomerase-related protein [Fulvivirga imtechensis AK7]